MYSKKMDYIHVVRSRMTCKRFVIAEQLVSELGESSKSPTKEESKDTKSNDVLFNTYKKREKNVKDEKKEKMMSSVGMGS